MAAEGSAVGAGPNRLGAFTITPGIQNEVEVKVAPNATCWLHAQGDDDLDHRIKVFADGEGYVRFHVGTDVLRGPALDPTTLVIDTESNGCAGSKHEVVLRAAHEPTHEFPPPPKPRAPQEFAGAIEYPGMTEAEALKIRAEDAQSLGLPPRPDQSDDRGRLDTWLRLVTRPSVFIAPQLRNNPDVSHLRTGDHTLTSLEVRVRPYELLLEQQKDSGNWCGYERLRGRHWEFKRGMLTPAWDARFSSIHGRWTVPHAYPPVNGSAYSCTWVGIDGDGTTDLVQAGTEHDSVEIGLYHTAVYYAWTEFLPQQPFEQVVANFPVSRGDDVRVTVDLQWGNGVQSLAGDAAFIISNLTTNAWTIVNTPRGTTTVGGTEAVWITERPTVSKSLPNLANFGTVTMTEAFAGRVDAPRSFVPYLSSNPSAENVIVRMVNGADVLATAYGLDYQSIRFRWHRFS